MKQGKITRAIVLSALAASTVLGAGCSSIPPVATSMAATPAGTQMAFHRKSSGSLGNFDGQVAWTFSNTTWQGQPAVVMSSAEGGATVFDPTTHATIATLDRAGKPLMSFEPPVGYQWPLEVGKTWTSTHTVTMHASGKKVPLNIGWKVESYDDVTVPAGTFKAYKVVSTTAEGEVEARWVSPRDGLATVKRNTVRPATHPQGPGVLDGELLSHTLPAK
ncbi:MAG: hypothetical protein Q7T10_16660 [Rhodoferax sp.]|uniref:hypothetical protein n=1 Tax=Rhodoferax sp. TaxID=50421 RepID=UPI00271955A7|nr:hypothetical protein [Rhodoferax sp.]MDO8450429.1 hypothetical protein [Rhodoferax sp.]